MSAITRRIALITLALAGAGGWVAWRRTSAATQVSQMFREPLAMPQMPLNIFHLGHSLVGQDMPAMLMQLERNSYNSQLGWGTSLKEHWEPDLPINGFEASNNHSLYRDARAGIGSGAYDTVILTEMVEITDAIRYHDSAEYVARWAALAHDANPKARVYLYETWHHTNDPKGWLERIDQDLAKHWQGKIANPAMTELSAPIFLIPAGQVMAAVVRKIDAGEVPGMTSVNDLFSTAADGTPDTIHFNDKGAYLVALTHYAVLYHRSPVGLPHALKRADGTVANAPSAEAAALFQQVVWDVVRAHPETGVAG